MAREDRLPYARVQPRAAQAREAVVERRPYERVGERVAPDAAVDLAQHPRLNRLVEGADERVARQRPERLQQPEVELSPEHARDLHRLPRALRQPRDPPRGDLSHALRHAGVLKVAAVAQRPPRRRTGCPPSRSAACRRTPPTAPRRAPSQLGDLAAREPLERHLGQHPVASQRGDQLAERVVALVRGRSRRTACAAPRRAREVAQELEGGPSAHWRSSRTSSSGAPLAISASQAATASNSR